MLRTSRTCAAWAGRDDVARRVAAAGARAAGGARRARDAARAVPRARQRRAHAVARAPRRVEAERRRDGGWAYVGSQPSRVPWRFSDDVEPYAERVVPLLSADPAAYTVGADVIDTLRAGHRFATRRCCSAGSRRTGRCAARSAARRPTTSCSRSCPTPASSSRRSAPPASRCPGSTATSRPSSASSPRGRRRRGLEARTLLQMRLFALGELVPPDPPPPGAARAGHRRPTSSSRCAGSTPSPRSSSCPTRRPEARARQQIEDGRLWLWEEGGEPVALARRNAAAAAWRGSICVYTPPEQRGRRYGGAVTAACCADALARERRARRALHRPLQPRPEQGLPADRLPPGERPPRHPLQPSTRGRPLVSRCGRASAAAPPRARAGARRSSSRRRAGAARRGYDGCLCPAASVEPPPEAPRPRRPPQRAHPAGQLRVRGDDAGAVGAAVLAAARRSRRRRRRGRGARRRRPRRARPAAARRRRARRSPARRSSAAKASSRATSRRAAPARSRHQPSGREPITLEASTTQVIASPVSS